MARTAAKFAQISDPEQRHELRVLWRQGASHRLRCRAHAILLSADGTAISELGDIFEISRPTVTVRIDRWNAKGIAGLHDDERAPRPNRVDKQQTERAVELIVEHPRQPNKVLAKIQMVDSQLVIDVMDDVRRRRNQETWVVLDNASPHTSRRFRAQEDDWNEQGLRFYFLPPRRPQPNWVERLWARIRYQWLPLDATKSLTRLQGCVDDILAKLG